ncbi:MAG: phenylalanine--tRNA ligase subunit beta [bacterium]|nr:phenylalanine--tRNA ligase subunit beta [bacterium]
MKAPLMWLSDLVRIDIEPAELADKLTMAGLEVGKVETGEWGAVFDAEITSNRGDCLSMLGLAREISALLDTEIKQPLSEVTDGEDKGWARVEVRDYDLCPRYAARVVDGIKIASSPEWVQNRLIAAGMRPINNVVDATNYVMLELGQPLHAFDYTELNEGRIIVRRAEPGEVMISIDGMERELDPQMLVIADAEQPVAVAGVMGGAESEVSDKTETILLESAIFKPGSVRRTSKRLGLSTEASYRFERGVDPDGVRRALDRVTALILEMIPGAVVRDTADIYPQPVLPQRITLRGSKVNSLLGSDLSLPVMASLLRRLHFGVIENDDSLEVTVPTYRRDVSIEVDLVEEIARLYGYNNFEDTLPGGLCLPGGKNRKQLFEDLVRDVLTGCSLDEAVCFSLTDKSFPDRLLLPPGDDLRRTVEISNPLTEDLAVMRTTLADGLLSVVKRNLSVKENDVAVFELGRVFLAIEGKDLPEEKSMVGIAVRGNLWQNRWNVPSEVVTADFYQLKWMVEKLLAACGLEDVCFAAEATPWLHPGRSAVVTAGGRKLGYIGEVHPRAAAAYDISGPAYLAELDFDLLAEAGRLERFYCSVPRFPAVERDMALLVSEEVTSAEVDGIIREMAGELIERVVFFDLYRGSQLPEGMKSLAYSIYYRSPERTLTDEEVNAVQERITTALEERLSAQLRR